MTELGLGSSSSDDDSDDGNHHRSDVEERRRATTAKPVPVVALLPAKRKARDPVVYEILSD
jgi:hypothetical protein